MTIDMRERPHMLPHIKSEIRHAGETVGREAEKRNHEKEKELHILCTVI